MSQVLRVQRLLKGSRPHDKGGVTDFIKNTSEPIIPDLVEFFYSLRNIRGRLHVWAGETPYRFILFNICGDHKSLNFKYLISGKLGE